MPTRAAGRYKLSQLSHIYLETRGQDQATALDAHLNLSSLVSISSQGACLTGIVELLESLWLLSCVPCEL